MNSSAGSGAEPQLQTDFEMYIADRKATTCI